MGLEVAGYKKKSPTHGIVLNLTALSTNLTSHSRASRNDKHHTNASHEKMNLRLIFLLAFNMVSALTLSESQAIGLAHETFYLILDKQVQPGPVTKLTCKFSYIWDFPRNMGQATLIDVEGDEVNVAMFPLGISGVLDFMNSDKTPIKTQDGQSFTMYRVVLDLGPNGERKASMMIGEDGSEILATSNWDG